MATDIFSIGVSGLNASQVAISTTAHNIANVNTAGYSRQRATFETRLPQFFGNAFMGSGSQVSEISRLFDQTVLNEIRSNAGTSFSQKTYLNYAKRLDSIIADPDTGLNSALQAFFSALHGVSDNPSSIPARQVLLSQGQLLANRFQTLDQNFTDQRKAINFNLDVLAKEITGIGVGIAELNSAIVAFRSAGGIGPEPNDLLDQRDRLVNRLSEITNVSTLPQSDGSVSVFLGTGQTLVLGTDANQIVAQPTVVDTQNIGLYLRSPGGTLVEVTEQLVGGEIGGVLQFRKEMLDLGTNLLGRVAIGISESFNDQHALGMDLNNQLGGLFFNDFNDPGISNSRIVIPSGYAGPGSFSADIQSVAGLTDSNYRVALNAGTYTVTRLNDNVVVDTWAAAGATTRSFDGLNFNVAADAANGDSFLLAPTRGAATQIRRVIDDVNKIAAASPVKFESVIANTGSGIVKSVAVTNTSATTVPASQILNGSLNPPYRIEFINSTSFNVVNANTNVVVAAAVAFTPNQDNNLLTLAGINAGYEVTLSGAPLAGDIFNIQYNTGGIGDNRNMQALARLQSVSMMSGGTATMSATYGQLIADVGSRTNSAEVNFKASEALYLQSKARREEMSGVSLDEEAANLIRFQQAYEASAQVISVANELFDVLFQSVR